MLTTWEAVSALDRMFNDVMGAALGTATNARTFSPDVDVRTNEDEVVLGSCLGVVTKHSPVSSRFLIHSKRRIYPQRRSVRDNLRT
jgi:hypothetical protein